MLEGPLQELPSLIAHQWAAGATAANARVRTASRLTSAEPLQSLGESSDRLRRMPRQLLRSLKPDGPARRSQQAFHHRRRLVGVEEREALRCIEPDLLVGVVDRVDVQRRLRQPWFEGHDLSEQTNAALLITAACTSLAWAALMKGDLRVTHER